MEELQERLRTLLWDGIGTELNEPFLRLERAQARFCCQIHRFSHAAPSWITVNLSGDQGKSHLVMAPSRRFSQFTEFALLLSRFLLNKLTTMCRSTKAEAGRK